MERPIFGIDLLEEKDKKMTGEKQKNPKKGKVIYSLWLTKEESKGLEEVINDCNFERIIGALVQRARRRGDFEKR